MGKKGPMLKGELGVGKNGKNIIHVDSNEEIELKP